MDHPCLSVLTGRGVLQALLLGAALMAPAGIVCAADTRHPPLLADGYCPPGERPLALAGGTLYSMLQEIAGHFSLTLVNDESVLEATVVGARKGCISLQQWMAWVLPEGLGYARVQDTLIVAAYLAPSGAAGEPLLAEWPATDDVLVVTGRSAVKPVMNRPAYGGEREFYIDREVLQQSGVRSLPAALELASGVKIEDNRYAIIRGMTGRYQSIQLNYGELPSIDPAGQSFPLDIIPVGILNSVDLRKSVYSDASGQGTAGVLNLNTMQLPESAYAQVSVSAVHRQGSNFSPVLAGGRHQTLPDGLLANAQSGGVATLNPAQRKAQGEAVVGDMGIYQARSGASGNVEFSMGTRYQSDSIAVGGGVSLTLRDRWQQHFKSSTVYSTGIGYSGSSASFHHEDSSHHQSEHTVDSGGLLTLGAEVGSAHFLGINYLWLHRTTSLAELIHTVGKSEQGEAIDTAYRRALLNQTGKALQQLQVYGRHQVTAATELFWQTSSTRTIYRRPHDLDYRYQGPEEEGNFQLQLNPSTTSIGWRQMDQQGRSVSLGMGYLYEFGDFTGELKAGWEGSDTTREGYNLLFSFDDTGNLSADPELMEKTNPSDILTAATIVGSEEEPGFLLNDLVLSHDDNTPLAGRFYSASQSRRAAYLLNDIDLSAQWRFISGLRKESDHLSAGLWNYRADNDITLLDHSLWLPSAALAFIEERQSIRFSYSKTLVWPDFNEILPVVYEDLGTRARTIGNPQLQHSEVHNVDLSWQWQGNDGPRMASAVYLKRIRRPIEGSFTRKTEAVDEATYSNYSYSNAPLGIVKGGELELDHQWRWYQQQFGLQARYARILSEVRDRVTDEESAGSRYRTRPLQGQPDYIGAFRFQYSPSATQSVSLFFKRSGRQLYISSDSETLPAVYQQARGQMDIAWHYRHGPLNMSFNVNNVLDTHHVYEQGGYEYLSYRSGREFVFSLDLNL